MFLQEVVREARRLLSADHFTVNGTLLEAWTSHKSYRPRGEEPPHGGGRHREADFKDERQRRETHESMTDPEARLFGEGKQQGAQLCYLGHALTENPHGLIVDVELTQGKAVTPNARRPWRCSNAASADPRPWERTAASTRATSSETARPGSDTAHRAARA